MAPNPEVESPAPPARFTIRIGLATGESVDTQVVTRLGVHKAAVIAARAVRETHPEVAPVKVELLNEEAVGAVNDRDELDWSEQDGS